MGKIINPHVQWEYMTVSIRNPNDIANELNRWGKNGWECFHIDITLQLLISERTTKFYYRLEDNNS